MAKKNKLSTPAWIMEGFDSEADYNKKMQKNGSSKQSKDSSTKKGVGSTKKKAGKTFKIRECPKCGSNDVGIVLSNSDSEQGGGDQWECHKCKWKGHDIKEKELTEGELMKYMDEKGEKI